MKPSPHLLLRKTDNNDLKCVQRKIMRGSYGYTYESQTSYRRIYNILSDIMAREYEENNGTSNE